MIIKIRQPDPAEQLAQWRETAIATPAQIEVTLYDLNLIDIVDTITNSNPRAAIIRRTALEFKRLNPLIVALGEGGFTPEQIDDIFRYAMELHI